jgi:HK97 family phage portal protein
MPSLPRRILDAVSTKDTAPVNRFEGFQANGAIVLRDRRGTRKAEIPNVSEKSETLGDSLAIYKPTGAKTVDAAKAMGNFTGWTFAAVNAIAREASNIQFRLYQIKGDDHIEQDDHPLLTLLEGVNEHMTGPELKYTTLAHLELTGNCYWLLDGVTNDRTPPRAIYLLNPGRVRVKLNKSSFPYKLDHYEYTLDGKIFRFQPYQILHLKYPDPNDSFVGVGFVQSIPSWIDTDNYAWEHNRKYFLNGASFGLYIATQTNIEGQIERIKQGFRDAHTGVENAHKIPALPKGVDLKSAGMTQRDMDFKNLADATRDRILAAAGVSKTILGTAESDTNRATAETADYVFSKRTIKPKMLLFVSYLNEFLVARYGDDLYLTFLDPTPEDKAARTTEMQAMVGSQPVMTVNEARQNFAGLGPVNGGDKLMAPAAMAPVGQTETPEGEEIAPGAAGEGNSPKAVRAKAKTVEGWDANAVRIRTGGKTAYSGVRDMRRALVKAFEKQLDKAPEFQTKSLKDLTHSEYMEHWKRFADRSERAEEELKKIFRGINAKQKEEVLANLPDATGIKKDLGELFDPQEWVGITIDLATPVLTALAKDEATAALAMVGAQHQDILADEATRDALERGIAKMADSYNETTLSQLKEVLGEKLSQEGGTNLSELTNAVDGVYSFADDRRAGLIAKTEAFRSANWANKTAWQESGVVQTVKWYTAEDAHVCQFCAAQDGKEIPIEQNFYDAGDAIKGADGGIMTADYGDIGAPPLHPDCRCYIRPETIQ